MNYNYQYIMLAMVKKKIKNIDILIVMVSYEKTIKIIIN